MFCRVIGIRKIRLILLFIGIFSFVSWLLSLPKELPKGLNLVLRRDNDIPPSIHFNDEPFHNEYSIIRAKSPSVHPGKVKTLLPIPKSSIVPKRNFFVRKVKTSRKEKISARHQKLKESTGKRKLIFIKNNPRWPWFRMAIKELKSCPANCTLMKTAKNLSDFDAVIFHTVRYPDDYPPPKKQGQVWVFFSMETPYYTCGKEFNGTEWHYKINWTMTYRTVSDIPYLHGNITKMEKPTRRNFTSVIKNKTKKAAWFVSNCITPSQRETYIRELNKTFNVDVFGKCGNHKCSLQNRSECLKMLSRDYKFYMSFENSFCVDYITEKVFLNMHALIVPVVRGAANYSRYLPPMSYINTADFKSPKHLGEYLAYLDKNDTAYLEYFQWRNHYTFGNRHVGICEVCKKLNDPSIQEKVYPDIHSWFYENVCHVPSDLKEIKTTAR